MIRSILLLFLLTPQIASAEFVLHTFSHHTDSGEYNERNFGVGYWEENYAVGVYENSQYKTSVYAALRKPLWCNEHIKFGCGNGL